METQESNIQVVDIDEVEYILGYDIPTTKMPTGQLKAIYKSEIFKDTPRLINLGLSDFKNSNFKNRNIIPGKDIGLDINPGDYEGVLKVDIYDNASASTYALPSSIDWKIVDHLHVTVSSNVVLDDTGAVDIAQSSKIQICNVVMHKDIFSADTHFFPGHTIVRWATVSAVNGNDITWNAWETWDDFFEKAYNIMYPVGSIYITTISKSQDGNLFPNLPFLQGNNAGNHQWKLVAEDRTLRGVSEGREHQAGLSSEHDSQNLGFDISGPMSLREHDHYHNGTYVESYRRYNGTSSSTGTTNYIQYGMNPSASGYRGRNHMYFIRGVDTGGYYAHGQVSGTSKVNEAVAKGVVAYKTSPPNSATGNPKWNNRKPYYKVNIWQRVI